MPEKYQGCNFGIWFLVKFKHGSILAANILNSSLNEDIFRYSWDSNRGPAPQEWTT